MNVLIVYWKMPVWDLQKYSVAWSADPDKDKLLQVGRTDVSAGVSRPLHHARERLGTQTLPL